MLKRIGSLIALIALTSCAHLNDEVNSAATVRSSRRPAQLNSDPKFRVYSKDVASLDHFNEIEDVITKKRGAIVDCYDQILAGNETVGYVPRLFQLDFTIQANGVVSLNKDLMKSTLLSWKKNPPEYQKNQECLREQFQIMHFPSNDNPLALQVTIEY